MFELDYVRIMQIVGCMNCWNLYYIDISRYHYHNFIQSYLKKDIFVTDFPFSNGFKLPPSLTARAKIQSMTNAK